MRYFGTTNPCKPVKVLAYYEIVCEIDNEAAFEQNYNELQFESSLEIVQSPNVMADHSVHVLVSLSDKQYFTPYLIRELCRTPVADNLSQGLLICYRICAMNIIIYRSCN